MKTKIVPVLAFALFISACAAPNTLQPIKTDIPAPEATPAGWFLETSVLEHVEESLSYSISISSWDINNPPPASDRQPNGLPYKGTKFDVTVIKDATTMEAAIEEVRRSGTPILAQRDVTLANGVPAVILRGICRPVTYADQHFEWQCHLCHRLWRSGTLRTYRYEFTNQVAIRSAVPREKIPKEL
jgi:hypothetical protein